MNAPKNRQSDERKSHIANFVLLTPVLVAWASWPASATSCAGGTATWSMVTAPSGVRCPTRMPNRTTRAPIGTSHGLEHGRIAEDGQPESEDEREVRRRRHVDAVPIAVPLAPVLVSPVAAGGTFLDRDRGTARNAHRVAGLVFGVLRCQKSSRASTCGISAKLYIGGDGIVHSSVRPSHGSSPDTCPWRRLTITLTMKRRTEKAMTKDPTVSS